MIGSKKMKKKLNKRIVLIGAVVILLLVGGAVIRSQGEAKGEETQTTTSEAEIMTIENTLSSDGEVEGSLEEEVSPHTGYYLEEVKVESGDALEEGDTILTYTNGDVMTAPYDCVIKSYSLPDEEDQLTTDHYVTISGTDVLKIELTVDEGDIDLVKEGDEAGVRIEATNGSYEGVVTQVSEVGDYSDSGSTFTVEVTFDNDGKVKMGMTGTASVLLEQAKDVLGVPVNAVTSKGGQSYVTVQKEAGTEEKVEVTTGIRNDAYVEIKDGLSEGDIVVVAVSEDDSSQSKGGPGNMPGGGMPDGGGMYDGGGPGGESGGMPPGDQNN